MDDMARPAIDDLMVDADLFAYVLREECDVDVGLFDVLDVLASMGYVIMPGHGAAEAYARALLDGSEADQ
jgi:hypothetical protein